MNIVPTRNYVLGLCAAAFLICAFRASAQPSPPSMAAKPTDNRQLVAVLDFEALGASKIEASAITDQVRERLLANGAYRLVDRVQMDKVLAEQALQQEGCTTQECAVQVGKILGVRRLVTGKVTRVRDLWVLSASLIDVETAETLRVVSVQSEGEFRAALTKGSAGLVARLTEGQAPVTAAAVAGPSVPRDSRQGFLVHGGVRSESGTFIFKAAGSAKPKEQVAVKSGGTVEHPTDGEARLSAAGIVIGGGYQWVLAPRWTLAVLLEGYSGAVSGDLAGLYRQVSGSNLGAEARYWFSEGKYVGGALMSHGETFTPKDDAKDKYDLEPVTASRGTAVAVVGGWEIVPRLTLAAALEIGGATFANADYSYGALKLTAAYHWPFPQD